MAKDMRRGRVYSEATMERRRAYNRAHSAKYRPKHERSLRRYCLERAFGLTLEDYDALMFQQGGLCAVCHRPERARMNGKVMRLAVDHCHSTNKIRGLLCKDCNTGLGNFQDSIGLLRDAQQYLLEKG